MTSSNFAYPQAYLKLLLTKFSYADFTWLMYLTSHEMFKLIGGFLLKIHGIEYKREQILLDPIIQLKVKYFTMETGDKALYMS